MIIFLSQIVPLFLCSHHKHLWAQLSLVQEKACSSWMGRHGSSTDACWLQPSTMTSWCPTWESWQTLSELCWWVCLSLSCPNTHSQHTLRSHCPPHKPSDIVTWNNAIKSLLWKQLFQSKWTERTLPPRLSHTVLFLRQRVSWCTQALTILPPGPPLSEPGSSHLNQAVRLPVSD
jgi:hypothetical protein